MFRHLRFQGKWLALGRVGAFAVMCGILTRFFLHLRHHWLPPATTEPAQPAPSWPPIEPAETEPSR
ncbi:MAG: hypothetical protein K1X95_17095 [Acidimicrobiia bacterium]|nr:hypothetical protein [Acidimicrobiia bacterium]